MLSKPAMCPTMAVTWLSSSAHLLGGGPGAEGRGWADVLGRQRRAIQGYDAVREGVDLPDLVRAQLVDLAHVLARVCAGRPAVLVKRHFNDIFRHTSVTMHRKSKVHN
jgi:hypothetical protein